MKTLLIALVLAFTATAAHADEAEEKRKKAQEELDAAKVKACEGTRKYLNAQKACAEDAAAANKITCSATTNKDMQALMAKCTERLQGKAPKAADPAKEACKALGEDGSVMFEASDPSLVACKDKLKAEISKAQCKEGVKKVKYLFQRGAFKPSPSTVFCK